MNERKSIRRRELLKALGLGGAGLAAGAPLASWAAPNSRPNIIVILTDDQGYGDVACYGAQDLKTPHMDALVAAGMRFDRFYANCPVCSPTRASLMSGRYPDLAGVPGVIRTHSRDSWGFLDPGLTTLPWALKHAGYHTALVGKWHLGLESPNTPPERGFDHFHGYLGDMMDDYYNHRRHGINYMRIGDKEIDPKGHATDLFSQWAADYLKSRGSAKPGNPFFLYLAYNAPHTPIQPPPEWVEKVKQREAGIDEKRAKLVALIEHLDDGIGKVLRALKDSGQAGNTLLVFTSDNGGQSGVGANNGALNGGKGQMFEGGIRVPMCAVWPGKIAPGSRSDRIGLTMDLYPTACEAAGAGIAGEIDGRSILPTLLGKDQPDLDERLLFWVRREGGGNYGGQEFYAVRKGDWKLLQNTPFEPLQLFNLKDDPQEAKPLPDRHPKHRELFNELQKHVAQAGAMAWRKKPVTFESKQ